MAKTSENAIKVYEFCKEAFAVGKQITAADIAEGTGLEARSVNGVLTGAFCNKNKGFMVRVPAEIELEDGTHKPVKVIQPTEKFDSWAPVTE